MPWMAALLIGLAGAIGTMLRYAITLGLGRMTGAAFPFGTLIVNLAGSFLLGIVAQAFAGATIAGVDARLVLGVGLLGGFTTYSSFNLEVIRLFEQGAAVRAAVYLLGTVLGCLAAGVLGIAAARWIGSRP
jgi:CrcB protein